MVNLRCYLDGGASQKGQRVFYMGGYLGRTDDWIRFNLKWRAFLRLNELDFFHMNQYVARKGPYARWTEDKRIAVIKRAITLITETAMFGVTAALPLADYESFSPEDRILMGNAYGLCATTCLAQAARALHNHEIREPAAYVFELGDLGQGVVRVGLDQVFAKKGYRAKYGIISVGFEDKKRLPGLQTADIIAWESGRYIQDTLGRNEVEVRRSLRALVNAIPHFGRVLDRKYLEGYLARRKRK